MNFIRQFFSRFRRKPKPAINPEVYWSLLRMATLAVKFSPPFTAGKMSYNAVPTGILNDMRHLIRAAHPDIDLTPGYPEKDVTL
jgi:hypothetical protein